MDLVTARAEWLAAKRARDNAYLELMDAIEEWKMAHGEYAKREAYVAMVGARMEHDRLNDKAKEARRVMATIQYGISRAS